MKQEADNTPQRRYEELQLTLQRIMRHHPHADAENVWHTLLLLELPPIERLRRGLPSGAQRSVGKCDGQGVATPAHHRE
jgi:hypothetical protein